MLGLSASVTVWNLPLNQGHLLSNSSLYESGSSVGRRKGRADLRVQPTIYWPTSYGEFANSQLLVGFLLSGGEFIQSAGTLGATFSF